MKNCSKNNHVFHNSANYSIAVYKFLIELYSINVARIATQYHFKQEFKIGQ